VWNTKVEYGGTDGTHDVIARTCDPALWSHCDLGCVRLHAMPC
jgi:hypothetical protein